MAKPQAYFKLWEPRAARSSVGRGLQGGGRPVNGLPARLWPYLCNKRLMSVA